jgi:hypothetical protein
MAIVVSDVIFEKITKRALAYAEEMFRRMVAEVAINNDGVIPEIYAQIHDQVVEEIADQWIESLACRINEPD